MAPSSIAHSRGGKEWTRGFALSDRFDAKLPLYGLFGFPHFGFVCSVTHSQVHETI